jgi:hypothetical protein
MAFIIAIIPKIINGTLIKYSAPKNIITERIIFITANLLLKLVNILLVFQFDHMSQILPICFLIRTNVTATSVRDRRLL